MKMMRWKNISMKMNILPRFTFFQVVGHPEIQAMVHSCSNRDTEQDSILFKRWNKEMCQKANQCYEPVLHAVSVESFGEHVLVIEDDPVIREYVERKENKPGCTLVLPQAEYWTKQFLATKKHGY